MAKDYKPSSGRKPNSGPYVITYAWAKGLEQQQERHTWQDACALMRELLIQGYIEVSVRFA